MEKQRNFIRGHELGYLNLEFLFRPYRQEIAKFLNLFNYDISYFDPYIKINKYKKYQKFLTFLGLLTFL